VIVNYDLLTEIIRECRGDGTHCNVTGAAGGGRHDCTYRSLRPIFLCLGGMAAGNRSAPGSNKHSRLAGKFHHFSSLP
jgi:hypothetical protein